MMFVYACFSRCNGIQYGVSSEKSKCITGCVDGRGTGMGRGRVGKCGEDGNGVRERRVKLQQVTSIRTPPGPLTQHLV